MRHLRTLGAVSFAWILAACVPLPPPPQARAAGCPEATAWSTAYARTRLLGGLGPGTVRVLRYQISVHPREAPPCSSLILTKTLALRRGPGPLQIVEIRSFYRHGRLVATHRARIGHELPDSGVYTARLTLPIPAQAPPGHYKMVSLLYARWGAGGSPTLIARTRTRFAVGP